MLDVNLSKEKGKFLEKLIDLARRHLDLHCKPKHMLKMAEAVSRSKALGVEASYEGEGMLIRAADPPESLPERASIAERHASQLHLQNTERVLGHAFAQLLGRPDREDEPAPDADEIDPDWAARFFREARYISTDEMQFLWGKVLAREIEQPGQFSLRALDALRNLSRREAEKLAALAPFAMYAAEDAAIAFPLDFLEKHCSIQFTDLLHLASAGLVQQQPYLKLFIANSRAELDKGEILIAGYGVYPYLKDGVKQASLHLTCIFSPVAKEMLRLIDTQESEWIAESLCATIRRADICVEGPSKLPASEWPPWK
jgi:hypothetical protein